MNVTVTLAPVVAEARFTNVELVFLVTGLTIFSLFTTFGNLGVFVAFFKNRELRTVSNYFVLSLATADVMIGAFSINFYTVYLAYGYWPLGRHACEFWLCMDYWCCQASVINLLVISVDRYLSVRDPLNYRAKRTAANVKFVIGLLWLISFLLWVPWIVSYPYIVGERTVAEDACYIQFIYESIYITLFTALLAYYFPIIILIVIYGSIYRHLLKRKRNMEGLRKRSTTNLESEMTSNGTEERHQKQRHEQEHDRATLMLVLIILAFFVTWLPYDIFAVVSPFCPDCVSIPLWDFGYIFCYANSFLNPFCYAFGNKKFKETFRKMLFGPKKNSVSPS